VANPNETTHAHRHRVRGGRRGRLGRPSPGKGDQANRGLDPPVDGAAGGPFCNNTTIAIPDDEPHAVTDSFVIAESFQIIDLNVSLNVAHSWVGDLIFTLEHVDNDRVGQCRSRHRCHERVVPRHHTSTGGVDGVQRRVIAPTTDNQPDDRSRSSIEQARWVPPVGRDSSAHSNQSSSPIRAAAAGTAGDGIMGPLEIHDE